MLENILKTKKCFKLVCGAGNEDLDEVEKLVYIYSKAGCNIFDISANVDVIKAAKRGLKKAGIVDNRFICVSVGIKGDPHVNKAFINSEKCRRCMKCFSVCEQRAIESCIVDESKCIGCERCLRICAYDAVQMLNKPTDLNNLLPDITAEGIDCIEFHAISDNDKEIFEKWKHINSIFDGALSICIDRAKLSNEKYV